MNEYIAKLVQGMLWKHKPMTEEELDRILANLDVYIDTHAGVVQFCRAIEEHHGIK